MSGIQYSVFAVRLRRFVRISRWRLFVVLWLAAFGIQNTVFAQTATARFETETQAFTVGDAVKLDLIVEHPAGQRVLPPPLDTDWGEVELQGVTQPEITALENGFEQTSIVLQVTAWQPGDYLTPPFEVRVASADGTIRTLSVPPFPLRVESVLNPDDLNARDIKPQADLPFGAGLSPLVLAGISAAVLIVGIGAFFVLSSRRSKATVVTEPPDNRPPHIIALAELDAIEQADLVGAGQFQTHYTRVSETVRRYIEGGVNVSAMEETTYELQRSLKQDGKLDKALQKQVIGLLQEADVVKFAKIRPNPADALELPKKARIFINASATQLQELEEEPT